MTDLTQETSVTAEATRTAAARLATRLAFFSSGFAVACWAPLIPFVKARIGADEAQLGLLLLCLGLGSVTAMPLTGVLVSRIGTRALILTGGFGMALVLPLLPLAASVWQLAPALALFGASLGMIDVAMNIHAVEVEARSDKPLMSGFHGLFSLGNFAGAGLLTLLLSLGAAPLPSALLGAVLTALAMLVATPRFLRHRGGAPEPLVLPRGLVLVLALLAGVAFLTEGAMLDWGALLVLERGLLPPESAGLGYMTLSAAMVLARMTGDRIITRLGDRRVLLLGGAFTTAGFLLLLLSPWPPLALLGFAGIGLGIANMVPIFFSAAGRQRAMPPGLAIAAVTTTGYAGILMGPAAIGFVAEATSISATFWGLAVLALLVPLLARVVTGR
ncbi:Fucose permease [Pseudooceanicola antarcticus]|uniref:Fucose permease n=1 Tax=Pseudooceanicola antarcticus TaxID=1247613 RepID=A0A285J778_9RHOB|nr:MFS transporter [Pseudooceanicola antarcticus]PJE27000.1 MFS transporter [Pseudooceanicola antarcticus]SNY56088.1 Fucose permease [Pseudooceanicola antarcticus]